MNTFLNSIQINETVLPIIEFNGERVLPFKLIDQVHGKQPGAAKENFKKNRERFIENEDFFEVGRKDFSPDLWSNFGFHTMAPNGFLITETGYLMLVKSFTDDLAWAIQRQLVRFYFKQKSEHGKITPREYRKILGRMTEVGLKLSKTTDAYAVKLLVKEMQILSAAINEPEPDLKMVGKDYRQLLLPGIDEGQGGAS